MKPTRVTLHEKLRRLHEVGDIVLYRWSTGRFRVAKDYAMLSSIRFEVLTCTKNYILFSSCAPCLFIPNGRPQVRFQDHDILSISDGPRKGMNITSSMLKDGEMAIEARHCTHMEVDEFHCEKWLEKKVMSMGLNPVYPVSRIIMPELCRISKKISVLKPQITNELKRTLGCSMDASVDEINQRFQENLQMFGQKTDDGWVVSNDHIASGGCLVAAVKGLAGGSSSSSMVHKMPLTMFQIEIANRHWDIKTTKDER